MSASYRTALGLLLLGALAGITLADHCVIVDRGDPLDGTTTITIIEPPAPCAAEPEFDGWECMRVQTESNPEGLAHQVEIRWNRVGLISRGTFTWLSGGGGDEFLRLNTFFAGAVQDSLDANDEIRAVELRWTIPDGYDVQMNGSMNVASNLADIWEYLRTTGVMEGVLGHVGNSGGTQMAADSLAYHEAEQMLDVVVHSGGPTFPNLTLECTDPESPIYGNTVQRRQIDELCYGDVGLPYCETNDPAPEPPYDCRSTLGSDADKSYEGMILCLVVGLDELDWLKATSSYYFENVWAGSLTYESPDSPHVVFESIDGAAAVEARIREAVNVYLNAAHDFDADGLVTLADAAQFAACISGPGGGMSPGCLAGNPDLDNDMDVADFAALQNGFTGP